MNISVGYVIAMYSVSLSYVYLKTGSRSFGVMLVKADQL